MAKGFGKISKLLINSISKTLNTFFYVKGSKVAYLAFITFSEPCIVIYIYIYMCVCVCVCVCMRERERITNKMHTFSH